MRAIVLLAALMIGGSVSAQQASYTYIPQPGGPYYPICLTALNAPKVGSTLQLSVCGPIGGSTQNLSTYLLTGVSNPNLDLSPLRIAGILYSSGDVMTYIPYGSSYYYSVVSIQIPSNASLLGQEFWQQVLSITSWRYGSLYNLSRGGHGVIGL